MSATYGNSTDNTPFVFEFIETVIEEYVNPTGISVILNSSTYTIGDVVTIDSTLIGVGSNYQIGIFVEDSSGTLRAMQF